MVIPQDDLFNDIIPIPHRVHPRICGARKSQSTFIPTVSISMNISRPDKPLGQDSLFECASFGRPVPLRHPECVNDEYMRVHIEDILFDGARGGG